MRKSSKLVRTFSRTYADAPTLLPSARSRRQKPSLARGLHRNAAAAGSQFDPVLDIITALDRGQGYAPLSGIQQRQRLGVLAGMDELTRLVAWYGR